MKAEVAPQNGDEMAINRPNDRFFNRAFRLQASTPPAIEHLAFAPPDSCTESAAEPSSLEQAMTPQQAMMCLVVDFAPSGGLEHFHFWCIQSNHSRRGFSSRKAALRGACL
jgi:hypothetical protein